MFQLVSAGFIAKLVLAAVLGGAIGIEREIHRRPAGIRTSMLVCLGAALYTLLSHALAQNWGDPSSTRIISNLIPGIGFLGAGAIIRERGSVVGLTTAATIFVMAAIGMAVGGGLYVAAAFTTIFALIVLVIIGWAEKRFGLTSHAMLFRLTASESDKVMKAAHEAFDRLKIAIQHFQVTHLDPDYVIEFEADVSIPQQRALMTELTKLDARCEVVSPAAEGHPSNQS